MRYIDRSRTLGSPERLSSGMPQVREPALGRVPLPLPGRGTYTLTNADELGLLLLLEGVAISGNTQATDTLTLTLGKWQKQ